MSTVTTRSAGLTAAAVLAGSIIAAQVQAKVSVHWWVAIPLGLATIVGIVVLLGTRLTTGPDAEKVMEWGVSHPSQFAQLVCMAKVYAAGGNESRVRFVDIAFYTQAVLVGVAVILALVSVRSR